MAETIQGSTDAQAPPSPARPLGELKLHPFKSTVFGNKRMLRVWLPPGYGDRLSRKRLYPVLYLNDGQNLFDPSTAFGGVEWQVDESLDDASEVGRCATSAARCGNDGDCGACGGTRDAIVIGIDNAPDRIWELTPTRDADVGDGGGADAYLMMVGGEL